MSLTVPLVSFVPLFLTIPSLLPDIHVGICERQMFKICVLICWMSLIFCVVSLVSPRYIHYSPGGLCHFHSPTVDKPMPSTLCPRPLSTVGVVPTLCRGFPWAYCPLYTEDSRGRGVHPIPRTAVDIQCPRR